VRSLKNTPTFSLMLHVTPQQVHVMRLAPEDMFHQKTTSDLKLSMCSVNQELRSGNSKKTLLHCVYIHHICNLHKQKRTTLDQPRISELWGVNMLPPLYSNLHAVNQFDHV
jgi:hypothetical protein